MVTDLVMSFAFILVRLISSQEFETVIGGIPSPAPSLTHISFDPRPNPGSY